MFKPDVIYQRVACGYTGIAAHYAARFGARLVWHVAHDSDVSGDSSMHGRNPLRRILEQRSVEYGIARASQIVTQTRHQADLLAEYYNRNADAVIPNFHPQPIDRIDKSGRLTVLWIANFKPWKQPDVFVRLAQALSDLKDVQFTMIGAFMAGPAEKKWAQSILERIDDIPNLDYIGQASQEEVNQRLARAHVFVNTSIHEGFPNTFIQAWMREVPVVSLNVNPDHVFDREKVGFYAGSEDALHRIVRRLLVDPSFRRHYAANASDYAMKTHSVHNAHLLAQLIDTGTIESLDRRSA